MSFNVSKAVKKIISSCLWSWTHNPYSSYTTVAAPTADTAAFATSEAKQAMQQSAGTVSEVNGRDPCILESSSKSSNFIIFH